MSLVVEILAPATLLLNIAFIAGLGLYIAERFFGFQPELWMRTKTVLGDYYRELSFGLAAIATSGSLYFSQVLGWEPCLMCWYQRILMYPLVAIFAVGLLFQKDDVGDYALPLTMTGMAIALYHVLVQRVQQFASSGCSVTSVSCSTEYTFHFGYITTPTMALTAFIGIFILIWRFSSSE